MSQKQDLNEAEAQTLHVGVLTGSVDLRIVSGHNEVYVTYPRKIMIEELERRNYLRARYYVKTVEDLARYFTRPPNQLGPTSFANMKRTCSANESWLRTQ
jgi:hypothetical protein